MEIIPRLWIEAAKLLGVEPESIVRCPGCANENLVVEDHRSALDPGVVERFLTCPSCGTGCSLRMITSKVSRFEKPGQTSEAADFAARMGKHLP